MRTTMTARHCDVALELRARARALLERLGRVASRPHDAQVLFAEDHGEAVVEVRLHTARGQVHVGKALAADHRTALDRAVARVRRQLDKKRLPTRRRSLAREPR
jgi:ribosome-associated translation inhibitor RaiA